MKRIGTILLILLMVLSLTACSQTGVFPNGTDSPNNSEVILLAKIMDINGTSVLLANMAEDAGPADIYQLNGGKIDITSEDGGNLDISALKRGMLVEITFNGMIQESFPMGLGGIKGIYIKSQSDDIAGLYRSVIEDLYAADPGLNSSINVLAFDLTKVSNITEAEKTALIYLIGNAYGMETIAGTYEELSEQGYINKEKLYFEKGLLFSIEDTAISGGKFTFNSEKWRSGLGAYFFHDCTAKKSKDGWNYTIGAEMIS